MPISVNSQLQIANCTSRDARLRLLSQLCISVSLMSSSSFEVGFAAVSTAPHNVSYRTDGCECIRLGLKFTLGRWQSSPARRRTKEAPSDRHQRRHSAQWRKPVQNCWNSFNFFRNMLNYVNYFNCLFSFVPPFCFGKLNFLNEINNEIELSNKWF